MSKGPATAEDRGLLDGQPSSSRKSAGRTPLSAPATGSSADSGSTDDSGGSDGSGKRRGRFHVLNWPLRSRMLLLVLVPLLAIAPLAGVRIVGESEAIGAASDIHDQSLIAQRVSDAVNAVGDERDLTEAAAAGQGFKDNKDLKKAEQNTTAKAKALDQAFDEYRDSVEVLPKSTQTLAKQARARLGDVESLRTSAQRVGTGAPTLTSYSTIIDNLLSLNDQLAANTTDSQLNGLVRAMSSIQQLEEQTSRQRGILFQVMNSGHSSLKDTENLEQARAQFTSSEDSLINTAPSGIVNRYQTTVAGNDVSRADGTIEGVASAAEGGSSIKKVEGTAPSVFADMTGKLGKLREVQAHAGDRITQRSQELLDDERLGLALNAGFILVVVLLSYWGAVALARSVVRPLRTLRTSALDVADSRLPEVVSKINEVKDPAEVARSEPIAVDTRDEVGQVARAFDRVHFEAVRLATEQALMRDNVNTMFTNLSRRSESLVLRQLNLIDELENGEQNPTQLASLFKLDHLATRMRRNNESLLVLAGEEQGRRWNRPVLLLDIARAAIAEVEQYERVATRDLPDVAVAGQAATDVVHLVAELIENAGSFSAPETEVVVSATTLTAGEVMVDITDAGIGVSPDELREINEKLAEPPVVDVAISRRMGLFVVGRLASKHGIRVWLNRASTGGTSAVVVLPNALLKPTSDTDTDSGAAFDAARRAGSDLDITDILGGGFESEGQGGRSLGSSPSPTAIGPANGAGPGAGSGSGTGTGAGTRAPSAGSGPAVSGPPVEVGPPAANSGPPAGMSPPAAEPPADNFTWFTEETRSAGGDAGTRDRPQGHPQPQAEEPSRAQPQQPASVNDFNWFEEPPTTPNPQGHTSSNGTSASGASANGTSDRLPIFEAIESEWFGPDGGPAASVPPPQAGQPSPPRHPNQPIRSEQPRPPESASPPGARQNRTDETMPLSVQPAPGRPGAPGPVAPGSTAPGPAAPSSAAPTPSNPTSDGVTAQGLPKRRPRSNLMPGSAAPQEQGAPAAQPAAVPPRSAEQLKDRLARFHQGVRHGKDAADGGGEGGSPV